MEQFNRILIVRTDRIGDVLLSTPVIKALRDSFPNSYIAMMVRPYARDIIEGNPYLDEVILYDKNKRHKGWIASVKFAIQLKKKNFDLAVVLHPTNRVHIITFLAGITERLGYNKKFGFLLTKKVSDEKRFGVKHELEYNLDLVRLVGAQARDKSLFMPVNEVSRDYIEKFLKARGVSRSEALIAIHPGASCPSKKWPPQRFAWVADRLIEDFNARVVIVGDVGDIHTAEKLKQAMRHEPIFACGKTTISQLACLLKRCTLFISNDSGPVHIASSLGVPVVDIFGRNEAGLSPTRWGPWGAPNVVLHKEIGCLRCLAHNCQKDFACLKAIQKEEVLQAARFLLESNPYRPR
jgi:heptosyltransferase-2